MRADHGQSPHFLAHGESVVDAPIALKSAYHRDRRALLPCFTKSGKTPSMAPRTSMPSCGAAPAPARQIPAKAELPDAGTELVDRDP